MSMFRTQMLAIDLRVGDTYVTRSGPHYYHGHVTVIERRRNVVTVECVGCGVCWQWDITKCSEFVDGCQYEEIPL